MNQSPLNETTTTIDSSNITNVSSSTSYFPTTKPTPIPTPASDVIYNPIPVSQNIDNYISTTTPTENASPTPNPTPSDNSVEIQSAINALGPAGGEITLQSDATLSSVDLQVKSNITISGVNPNITLHLESKRLNVAKNAENVTIKNLVIDATNLGNRNTLVVYTGAQNISIQNITIQNHLANNTALITQGKNVEIQNLTFINVTNSYPVQIAGSNTYVKSCYSDDRSTYALVTVSGGITNTTIEENVAKNRPLFNGGYTTTPSSNIWIINNKLINFPRQTYGILVMGGTGATNEPFRAPFDEVYILGNTVKAGVAAYNGIAIYGLSSNVIVANNTVDQTLSGHNAIGVASGVNVTVTQNTVFGCIEGAEGGIEVESNPVHNRFIGISENVNVTKNIIYGSQWGVYVRIMVPDHENWQGTPLKSKNILIEENTISSCSIGINLLHGDGIIVRANSILNNTKPFVVSQSNVLNYTISNNIGYAV